MTRSSDRLKTLLRERLTDYEESGVIEALSSSDGGEVATISRSDLPPELVSAIADRLGLIELLGFRGTCKEWHSASSTASAQIESSPNHNPWFLLYGENSECVLYNESDKKKYTISIPELDGATCLASDEGWLLLFKKGSIFFFCPFSGAKIDLPQFPHSELSNHVAAFSSPPTSHECIVSVINRRDKLKLELNVVHRGDNTWTKHEQNDPLDYSDNVTCATYHEGHFYYLDNKDGLLTFSVSDKTWMLYRIIEDDSDSNADRLHFGFRRSYFGKTDVKKGLELEDNVSISTCGTRSSNRLFINNESVKASKEPESRHLKGIWIQPRFHQIPPNQSWLL
ncbi:F-box/kelch-repeat protein At1g57790-like [Cornus florida]|uniref:F-box/kelch-repeat protein At1g57790-like n=1 Tax=Cornus florida TaxID=4283 RepID=UPI00289E0C7A|nr:F-box/kelch-repeat protein At1g57790-like [Cornus florida]